MIMITDHGSENNSIMLAILFYIYNPFCLTGSTINIIEYFLAIYEHNPDIKLLLVNGNEIIKKTLIDLILNRYDIDDLKGFEDNIVCLPKVKFIRQKFMKVLVLDYSTIYETKDLLFSKELIVIQEKHTHEEEYQFDKYNSRNQILFGEMPWQIIDRPYRMKMLFHRFKKLENVKEAIYVNSPKSNDFSFLKNLDLPDKLFIYKARKHKNNLFEQFDEYVYFHQNTWFDPHPRLFCECYYYGKKIHYYNYPKIIDGSFYRYNDVMKNGISNRILGKNDEIVKRFL